MKEKKKKLKTNKHSKLYIHRKDLKIFQRRKEKHKLSGTSTQILPQFSSLNLQKNQEENIIFCKIIYIYEKLNCPI